MESNKYTHSSFITVIMPVYNGERYLEQAIQSALGQTYRNFELIVVDDGSSDQSTKIVEQHLSDERVVLLRNEKNMGVAASRNHALKFAKGDLITFLDQDDIWLPNKLELQVSAIENHPDIGLLHAGHARIDTNSELLPAYRQLPPDRFGNVEAKIDVRDVFGEIFISNNIQPLTTMIPRKVLDEVGWFNAELPGVDDYELWLRIALRYPIGHLQTIVGYWRAHPGQQSNQGYRMLMIRLKAVDLILSRFHEAKQRVPGKTFRKRMHGMCTSAANYTMYYLHDYLVARDLFARALKYHPLDLPSWGKYAYCALPSPLREGIKKVKGQLKAASIAKNDR